ncbi:MAG: PEP-CTERM sorting domain-containing protein [Armatimonadetes bacterium]|nr:PEP-CTERM sorting domain-containing protein [Armatimonadota bacterium]
MRFCLIALALASVALLPAQRVTNRGDLKTILNNHTTLDTFDLVSFGSGNQVNIYGSLNYLVDIQGYAGVVHKGASYYNAGARNYANDLFLPEPGFYGLESQKLLAGSASIGIQFERPMRAVGLDVTNYAGFIDVGYMAAYDSQNHLLGTVSFRTGGYPDYSFLGWESEGNGIAKVIVTGSRNWSPVIDNVEYDGAVPEPSSLLALALGAIALGRKRSQQS